MSKTQSPVDPDLVSSYFDRMLAIQSSIKELQAEYQQLLKDADVDGLERKALGPLINLLAAETRPRSEKLLNAMIEYARHAGLNLDAGSSEHQPAFEPVPQNAPVTREPGPRSNFTQEGPQSNFTQEGKLLGNRMALLLQAIIGLAAGSTLVWLLH